MAFNSEFSLHNDAGFITLDGELDRTSAPTFQKSVEEAAAAQVKRLVLRMEGLSYMASAGLRVLVFAKQKMGAGVDIYMVGVTEEVAETIKATGFHNSVHMVETYDS
jgi:anti-sigma B factor antagonist